MGLYYPCSENKGADQLRGYREADLRLCFRICKKTNKRFSHDAAQVMLTICRRLIAPMMSVGRTSVMDL